MYGGRGPAGEWAIPTKPVPDLLRGWARVQAAAAHARMRIVVVGGGAGGVELALAMHSQMRNEAEFTIIHAGPQVAAVQNRALPKSGVFAVRMAKPLERNLRAYLAGTPVSAYKPQRHSLSLIGTADWCAITSYGPWAGHSALFWQWKDWIDRRFMKQFTNLTS
jgi:NADH dehydrogenase FAD-containing subunit